MLAHGVVRNGCRDPAGVSPVNRGDAGTPWTGFTLWPDWRPGPQVCRRSWCWCGRGEGQPRRSWVSLWMAPQTGDTPGEDVDDTPGACATLTSAPVDSRNEVLGVQGRQTLRLRPRSLLKALPSGGAFVLPGVLLRDVGRNTCQHAGTAESDEMAAVGRRVATYRSAQHPVASAGGSSPTWVARLGGPCWCALAEDRRPIVRAWTHRQPQPERSW
jgi:hypothetical protein